MISITSSGQITALRPPPYFILIDKALRDEGILAVEMEAAALYAFAQARRKPVPCFAHVNNQMGREGDFEKGEANGATAALGLVHAVANAWAASTVVE
ncbi:phosphorylase family protein [Azospirillum canadense]|uniref:phosphorylase family protein n=1 Tax=Azospirillum canadense TaxID=403962 RepID=UPI002227D7C9|nr:hypothetical protein [Azospirillum canadense]MCW2242460.1 uridine phosphorylase [Azospirillum canadense]